MTLHTGYRPSQETWSDALSNLFYRWSMRETALTGCVVLLVVANAI